MFKLMLTLLVALSTSALAQNTPIKTTLIKAGRVLDVKAGVYQPNQGVLARAFKPLAENSRPLAVRPLSFDPGTPPQSSRRSS